MIKVSGTLAVRTINGCNGPFNLGKLETEIGVFAVKDPELDQFDEGRFEGEFGIERMYITSRTSNNVMYSEIRAELGLIALVGIHDLKPEDKAVPAEQDPAEEVPPATLTPAQQPAEAGKKTKKSEAKDTDPEALFGLLWPLGNEVKLDSTIDRSKLREQSSWLKANGYEFRVTGNKFVKTPGQEGEND